VGPLISASGKVLEGRRREATSTGGKALERRSLSQRLSSKERGSLRTRGEESDSSFYNTWEVNYCGTGGGIYEQPVQLTAREWTIEGRGSASSFQCFE